MSKYIAVAKVLFKNQIIYRFDVMFTAIGTIARIVFAWILWGAIFESRAEVGGFTFAGMLSYYVISSFLNSTDLSYGVSGEVSQRIRGGTFTRFMVIPSDPQLHFMAQSLGASAYYAIFAAAAATACAVVMRVGSVVQPDPAAILCAVVMALTGLVFMASYHFFIGVLTFKFQDIGFFMHVQGSVLAFLTGSIVPLTLLPGVVQGALKYLPFTYVTFAPAMMLTGQMGAREGLFGLAALFIWTAAMMTIGKLTYERLRVKYDGVGI